MKSKEILPESEREKIRNASYEDFAKLGLAKKLLDILEVAESEIEELRKQNKDILQVVITAVTAFNTVEAIKEGDMEKMATAIEEGVSKIRETQGTKHPPVPMFVKGEKITPKIRGN
jgi:hypothetical protein